MTEEQVFLAALDLPDGAARTAYLDDVCGEDSELRRQVEELLAAHERSDQFLDEPAVEQLAAEPQSPKDQTVAFNDESADAMADNKKTNASPSDDESDDLNFLSPSTRPDSLGRLGHYEVLQMLGKGGFGIVFRAFDDMLQRVVAVKVMAPQIATLSPARKRFLREARSSAAVRHENVVHVYEVGEQPLPYLVMEFIPGETLQQRLNRTGPLDVPEVLRIGRQIAEGLAAAHACDLIHRDIKPSNILLEGGSHKVKITDFGLARAADDASISQSGVVAGTPMFMAPEQALGHKIDQRADLFSLGSVLYQMASGRPPFRAPSTLAVLKRVAEESPRPIPEIIPETPDWLCGIITKLHAKNPDDRFQSAREVADLLADCEAKLKAKRQVKNVLPAAKRAGRKWIAAAAVLLLPVIALAVTEFAGVTHLFRQQATSDAIKDGRGLTPNQGTKQGEPESNGWVQLFNGKDLTGWKTHPEQPGEWKVVGGVLMGSTVPSYLFSEGGKFENFHLRIEAKINHGGDSGIYFRAPFSMRQGKTSDQLRPAGGYEVELQKNPTYLVPTGSIWDANTAGPPNLLWKTKQDWLTKADEWLTLEIIAQGNRIISKVNGTQTADCHDPLARYDVGHFALQVFNPQTHIQFRKIEIKELLANTKPDALPPTITNTLGMEFKLIPAGKFTMGSPKEEIDRCLKQLEGAELWVKKTLATEGPEHLVEITQPFYLGATEVTVGQFRQFVDEQGYQVGDGRWRNPGFDQTDQHPVVWVSWHNAVDFCKWLSKKEGKEYRLPTEAEWEYSCRAGKAGSRYCFGDDDAQLEEYAWYATNSGVGQHPGVGTHPVGKKKPNAWGLYGMHGNAWEWCQDNYDPDYYKNSPVKDPPGPSAGGGRVARGGSWPYGPVYCRSAFRGYIAPDFRGGWGGFRVLLVSPPGGVGTERGATDKPPPPAIAPFTDADVQRIAALPAAEQVEEVQKELKRRNSGFDGKLTPTIEDNVVIALSFTTDHVTDISPIRALTHLRTLTIKETIYKGSLADLTPLKGMKLTGLRLWYSHKLVDLTPLRGMPLEDLDVWHWSGSDLTPLQGMPLKSLNCGGSGQKLDLTQLAGLPLEFLCVNFTQVSDLAPLKDMPLKELEFTNTKVIDVAPLKGIKTLQKINLKPAAEFWKEVDAKDKGTAALAADPDRRAAEYVLSLGGKVRIYGKPQLFAQAAELPPVFRVVFADLGRNKALTDEKLALFQGCTELMGLDLSDTPITDAGLVHLKSCKTLGALTLAGTWVSADLAPLKECENLGYLNLDGTRITEAGLAHLKEIKSLAALSVRAMKVPDAWLGHIAACKNLMSLSLEDTPVTDAGLPQLAGLSSLFDLNLRRTKVTAAGIEGLAKALPHCKISWDGSAPDYIPVEFSAAEAKKQQEEWAAKLKRTVETTNSIGMKLILIPPTGSIALKKPYLIGKYELTHEEWHKVMGDIRREFNVGDEKARRLPVSTVSWYDGVEFCNKLSEKEGLKPYYELHVTKRSNGSIISAEIRTLRGNGYRLPTNAEWEHACRAGTRTKFPFGEKVEDLPAYAWFADNSGRRRHGVGELKPNNFGLHDMLGNVAEWTDARSVSSFSGTLYSCIRGGTCGSPVTSCNVAYRVSFSCGQRILDCGFRVARSPLENEPPVTAVGGEFTK